MKEKDINLITQIKQNNINALTEFLDYHQKTINICKKKFSLDIDTILDKIFDIIICNKHIKNIDAYLYSMLRNYAYSLYKSQAKEKILNSKYSNSDLYSNLKSDIYFFNLIDCLDKDLQTILILRFINGYTIREIAKLTGIPKSTVDYRLRKSYTILSNKLS